MKKITALVILLILATATLVACTPAHWMDSAISNGDSYTMVMGYDDTTQCLSVSQQVTTTNNTTNSLSAVKMHLYPNAYREGSATPIVPNSYHSSAYPNGTSYGNITIDSVSVDGQAVAYTIEGVDNDILSIPVSELFGDESVTIDMQYTVSLPNMAHRLGYTDNTVNLGNYYPILCRLTDNGYDTSTYYAVGDPFVSEMSNYNVSITVPSQYTVASTGDLVQSNATDTSTTYQYTAHAVRDYALVLCQQYQHKSATVGDTTLHYYYYQDSTPDNTLATIIATYNYMTTHVGKYPYQQYTVAQTDMCYGGMEYPQMVMASGNTSQYINAVVHETVHQWFYGIIGNDQINDAWMDEGLTEFVTMLILDDNLTETLATNINQMYKSYTTYVDVLSNYYGDLDTSYRPLSAYKNDQDYVYTNYVKGSIMFYNLYDTMGVAKFHKALSSYYQQYAGSIATPAQLIECFGKAFGADMEDMFMSYIEGKDIVYRQSDSATTSAHHPSIK